MLSQTIQLSLLALIAVHILYSLLYTFISPLRRVPGPLAGRFTKLWWLNRMRHGNFQHENIALHQKYNLPVVRLGPDHYSINDPGAVKQIYGIGSKFRKSDWYYAWQRPDLKQYTLFADRDIKRHAEARKRFQNLYSMTSLISYESFVDECTDIFLQRLREMVQHGRPVDMGHWFQCYAFDVIACITYGNRFGFLDRGEDVRGTIAGLDGLLRYSTLVGVYSSLHPWVFGVAAKLGISGAAGRIAIQEFVGRKLAIRGEERKLRDVEKGRKRDDNEAPKDFLERLFEQHDENPEKTTMHHIFIVGLANVVAGSDTTAASLSGVLFHLLKNPRVLAKLREEVKEFDASGRLSEHPALRETQQMPYLEAVTKEALRMHAAVGLPLWRVVPEGGAEISGQFFPAGTNVGINSWVAHFNEEVWGADVAEFRPERWLEAQAEADAGHKERLQQMEGYYLPFGLGSRTCIGRHISIMEISKLLPRLLRVFEYELEHGSGQKLECDNFWFVKPSNFSVMVKRAKGL